MDRMRLSDGSTEVAVELSPETGLYVGYVPGYAGAHAQGASLEELARNMEEVVSMLREDDDPTAPR